MAFFVACEVIYPRVTYSDPAQGDVNLLLYIRLVNMQ